MTTKILDYTQLETDYFPGGHQISGAHAYDFLKEKLSPSTVDSRDPILAQ
jgi:hypothetical protein